MAKNERKSENDCSQGYQGGNGVVSVKDKETSKEDTKKCNKDKDRIKFCNR